ncbi:MAG: hypothetical protein H7246_15980 [Phycisphaerae bacterium]|nr:hypothetical protein [Saprospiraceae bacterium]
MAFNLISQTQEALLEAFQSAVKPLLYPSETDAPIEVQIVESDQVGETFTGQDIQELFYGGEDQFPSANVEWAEANRLESNGTQRFFRERPDIITTYPNNEYEVRAAYYRESVPQWRLLRDLFFDNLVQQRWFRANLAEPDSARADIYLIGRHLQIEVDSETNEMRIQPLNWFLLKTYVIET